MHQGQLPDVSTRIQNLQIVWNSGNGTSSTSGENQVRNIPTGISASSPSLSPSKATRMGKRPGRLKTPPHLRPQLQKPSFMSQVGILASPDAFFKIRGGGNPWREVGVVSWDPYCCKPPGASLRPPPKKETKSVSQPPQQQQKPERKVGSSSIPLQTAN